MSSSLESAPTILVAYGATGDLMRRKVIPTLFYLFKEEALSPGFQIVGFSRRDLNTESFRDFVVDVLETHQARKLDRAPLKAFLQLFQFQQGDFNQEESYVSLRKTLDAHDARIGITANKIFYLSVAPEFYEPIFEQMSRSGLSTSKSNSAWTRVMVEKPFGVDSHTAKRLDELLGSYFTEDQIYRIDHYLAKEMLQNILTFRFANNLFELNWGAELIERIDMRLLEEIGVEKRGAFYDAIGAFRDVGQNHFLQMLALVTMEHPGSFDAAAIQEKRAEILEKFPLMDENSIRKNTARAQYEGYKKIDGVESGSSTETFFRVDMEIDTPKWKGVPISMVGGKRLGAPQKEIVVTFRHPSPCLCPKDGPHHKNLVIIRLEPKEEILIEFWSKKPGLSMETETRMFHFLFRESSARMQYVEEYARLLVDCMRGDQSLFISTREVAAMWRFSDPILAAWEKGIVPLEVYNPDTKDILDRA